MQNGKSGKKREYLNKYVDDGSGGYVYTGIWYTLRGGSAVFRKMRHFYVLLAAAEIACLLGMGCLPIGSSRTAYVMLAYVLGFLPALQTAFAAASAGVSGGRLTEHRYRKSIERLQSATVLGVIFGAAAGVGQILYLLTVGEAGSRAADLVFLLGCLFVVLLHFLTMRVGTCYPWKAEDNPTEKK